MIAAALPLAWCAVVSIRAQESATDAAWSAAARLDFKAARTARADGPDGAQPREQQLQQALLLIVTPPQTETRFEAAAAQLHALSEGAQDDVAALAAYQFARLAHTRRVAADDVLINNYREVWTRFPGTLQAERAFVFAAILRQYRAGETPEEKRAALARLDTEAARTLRTVAGRRSYHLASSMAWARLLQDDEQACAQLEAVYALGLASQYTFSDVLFRLGEYHRRRGDAAGAIRYFKEFIAHYPVDRRTDLARRLINEISSRENA